MSRKEVEDLTGKTFGKWQVLSRAEDRFDKKGYRLIYWNCKCECGTGKPVGERELKRGRSKSCGCSKKELKKDIEDLTGNKFERWTVLKRGEDRYDKNNHVLRTWLCRCNCGNKREVLESSLRNKNSLSCGCLHKEVVSNNFVDLSNQKFGRWTVLEKTSIRKNGSIYWLCKCDCGTIKHVKSSSLKDGSSLSCGCYNKERTRESQKLLRTYNEYDLSGEYGIGYIKDVKFFFDLEDYDKIKKFKWQLKEDGYVVSRDYDNNNARLRLNRLIMNITDCNICVDHINHNVLDNRKQNLRPVSNQENSMNHKLFTTNTSGETGVYKDKKRNKWIASIGYNYNNITIGRYNTFEEAVIARKKAEEELFKEYSYDNSMLLSNTMSN